MFDIILQTNFAEKNRVSKSPTNVLTLSGELKNSTSIINPVILIEANLANISSCNYFTIPAFGRSYFLTDITSVSNDLIQISGHVDVLFSFKSQILTNKAIIKRQENNWNLYLNDGTFKVYQNPIVLTKPFPNAFSNPSFVLAVAGGQGNQVVPDPVTFLSQPQSVYVEAGTPTSFSVVVSGNISAFRWQTATATGSFSDTTTAAGAQSTYNMTSAQVTADRNGWRYRCKVADNNGDFHYSEEAVLNII